MANSFPQLELNNIEQRKLKINLIVFSPMSGRTVCAGILILEKCVEREMKHGEFDPSQILKGSIAECIMPLLQSSLSLSLPLSLPLTHSLTSLLF